MSNFKNILLASGSERDIPPMKKEDPVFFSCFCKLVSFFPFCPHKEKRYLCVNVRQLAKRKKKKGRGDKITTKGAVMSFPLPKVFGHFIILLIT